MNVHSYRKRRLNFKGLAETPCERAQQKGRTLRPALSAMRWCAGLFGGQEGAAELAAAIELEQVLDALLRDVVADHAVAFGIALLHVDIGRVHRLGAVG